LQFLLQDERRSNASLTCCSQSFFENRLQDPAQHLVLANYPSCPLRAISGDFVDRSARGFLLVLL
jgi:hypothetical protein